MRFSRAPAPAVALEYQCLQRPQSGQAEQQDRGLDGHIDISLRDRGARRPCRFSQDSTNSTPRSSATTPTATCSSSSWRMQQREFPAGSCVAAGASRRGRHGQISTCLRTRTALITSPRKPTATSSPSSARQGALAALNPATSRSSPGRPTPKSSTSDGSSRPPS